MTNNTKQNKNQLYIYTKLKKKDKKDVQMMIWKENYTAKWKQMDIKKRANEQTFSGIMIIRLLESD